MNGRVSDDRVAGWLFGVAAGFNGAAGAGLLLARQQLSATLSLDPITGTNIVAANLLGGFVLLFGLLYLLVALRPATYRVVVAPMVLGKLVAALAAVVPWLQGDVGPALPLVMVPDLCFAVAFAAYLMRTRE